MSRHQLQLHGSGNVSLDREALGKKPLAEALKVTDATVEALRAQGQALYRAGQYARAVAVFEGLAALSRSAPWDLVILSRCQQALGRSDLANMYAALAEDELAALERILAGRNP